MSQTVPDEVESLLTSEPLVAHLATSVEDRPHVAPVWYLYADETVEIVTGGRKLANIRENPRVAVSIQKDEGGHTEWMVSLLGTATVIDDEAAYSAVNRRINEKYDGDEAYPENMLVRISVGTVNYRTY
mgnify:CR=1 FL=1